MSFHFYFDGDSQTNTKPDETTFFLASHQMSGGLSEGYCIPIPNNVPAIERCCDQILDTNRIAKASQKESRIGTII